MKKKLPAPAKSAFFLLTLFIFFLSIANSRLLHSQTFTDSNLPIVIINTYGTDIDNNTWQPKVMGMGIINNGIGFRNYLTDPPNSYNGNVTVEIRGSSTLMLPKRSWNITTIDASQQEMNVNLFGFPAEHDWVFRALYQDKTFIRDELSFKIHKEMGHYSSRTKFFELVVDGDYRGVYEIEEKIKRDKNRVDISKLDLDDNAGDSLTGGYIIKLDRKDPSDEGWYSAFYSNSTNDSANFFEYNYPNPDSMPQVQKNYIKNFFDQFESTLNSSYWNDPLIGYRKYINVASFIDKFLIEELSRNTDGYRLSSYFYKDRDSKGDGKLHCGPVWDYNIAWANCAGAQGADPSGWQYPNDYFNTNYIPFWWKKLLTDNFFQDELKCRYQYHRQSILDQNYLFAHIDSFANYFNESQQRNFQKWPIMGIVVPPQPSPAPADYAGEIANLKNWIQQRLAWMDVNIPGICQGFGIAENNIDNGVTVYPNPSTGKFQVAANNSSGNEYKIEICNVMGEKVYSLTYPFTQLPIDLSSQPKGIYFYQLSVDNAIRAGKIIIQ